VVIYAVSYWNTFLTAAVYSGSKQADPAGKLYQVLTCSRTASPIGGASNTAVIPENLKGATVVIAVLPIDIVYPLCSAISAGRHSGRSEGVRTCVVFFVLPRSGSVPKTLERRSKPRSALKALEPAI
jgi:hypothetical protein